MFKSIFLIALLMSSCSKADETPEKQDPAPIADRYAQAVARLDSMSDQGWVVARDGAGNAYDIGDSLIFTGVALAALPCDHTTPLLEAFPNGQLYRHPSLPNEISLDGALGYYFGVAARQSRCGQGELWRSKFEPHLQSDSDYVPREFTYVRDLLGWRLGLRGEPSTDRRRVLEAQVVVWARAVRDSRSACYRIHLGWLVMRTLEMLDSGPTGTARDAFCSATEGTDLPVVDNWCGREGLLKWIDEFQPNQWGYRHQRCPAWDTADGNGREQPMVDYLLGIREAYNVQ